MTQHVFQFLHTGNVGKSISTATFHFHVGRGGLFGFFALVLIVVRVLKASFCSLGLVFDFAGLVGVGQVAQNLLGVAVALVVHGSQTSREDTLERIVQVGFREVKGLLACRFHACDALGAGHVVAQFHMPWCVAGEHGVENSHGCKQVALFFVHAHKRLARAILHVKVGRVECGLAAARVGHVPHVDEFRDASRFLTKHDVVGGDVVVKQHAWLLVVHVVQSMQNLGDDMCGLFRFDFPLSLNLLGQQFTAEVGGDHVVAHTLGNHQPSTVHQRNDVTV